VTDRWWSERNISQRSSRGATSIGRDQLRYTDQRNNPVINNNHRISFNSIQDAVEFADQRAAPLHAEIAELHGRLEAADDYADDLEGQLHSERAARRLGRTQLAAAAIAAFAVGCALMYAASSQGGSSRPVQASATVTALPEPPPETFTTMPCDPGRWVTFLATYQGEYARFMAVQELATETARAGELQAKLIIQASTWAETCPEARDYAKSDETRTFLWTGPFESKPAAQRACVILRKAVRHDCLVEPTTSP
jgi:hypothetical protein